MKYEREKRETYAIESGDASFLPDVSPDYSNGL